MYLRQRAMERLAMDDCPCEEDFTACVIWWSMDVCCSCWESWFEAYSVADCERRKDIRVRLRMKEGL